ncbi:hypothetical protein P1J78_10475 [Psychromarinibacter sp. C21-152]|uniref:Uncharacterized protein n=1 Tax=Psychromarinibacter sediminicola TaxID=3033385 RepID=A0AAE3NPJ1_9RHOB|nr:hypothetical protein [Psychromarinibacter sediminicola]MDF0601153.1 hypothetical protein [Psychromarinibacter sediminicola]
MRHGMNGAWTMRGGAVALLLSCTPVSAEPAYPDGCTPELTVQNIDCEVDIYLACGDRVRVQNYGPDGPDTVEEMTADWSLLFSMDTSGPSGLVVRDGPAEPLSRDALLAEGISRFSYPVDFYLQRPEPVATRLTGTFRMTGDETEIDGHVLQRVETRMTVDLPPPAGPLETIQTGYYSEALDVFMEGPGSLRLGDRVQQVTKGPKRIILPGADGFLSTVPLFGCVADEAFLAPGNEERAG